MKAEVAVSLFDSLCEHRDLEGLEQVLPFLPDAQHMAWGKLPPLYYLYHSLEDLNNRTHQQQFEFTQKALGLFARQSYLILDQAYISLTTDEEKEKSPTFPLIDFVVAGQQAQMKNKVGKGALAYCLKGNALFPSWLMAMEQQGVDLLDIRPNGKSIWEEAGNPDIWLVDETILRWIDQTQFLLDRTMERGDMALIKQAKKNIGHMFAKLRYEFSIEDEQNSDYISYIAPLDVHMEKIELTLTTPKVNRKRAGPRL